MQSTLKIVFASLVVAAVGVTTAHAIIRIPTSFGAGADSGISNDIQSGPDVAGNGISAQVRFESDELTMEVIRYRATFLRFDLSEVPAGADVSGAGLSVHNIAKSRPFAVYGMLDTTAPGFEDWDEGSITFNNAPGITNQGPNTVEDVVDDSTGDGDPAVYTLLGLWDIPGPGTDSFPAPPPGTSIYSTSLAPPLPDDPGFDNAFATQAPNSETFSANLTSFIQANSLNDTITLLLFPTVDTTGEVTIRTKEYETHPSSEGIWAINPTLELPNAEAPVGLVGDYNDDGSVDAADYVIWRATDSGNPMGYDDWRANFGATQPQATGAGSAFSTGAVPEPGTLVLALLALPACCRSRRATKFDL